MEFICCFCCLSPLSLLLYPVAQTVPSFLTLMCGLLLLLCLLHLLFFDLLLFHHFCSYFCYCLCWFCFCLCCLLLLVSFPFALYPQVHTVPFYRYKVVGSYYFCFFRCLVSFPFTFIFISLLLLFLFCSSSLVLYMLFLFLCAVTILCLLLLMLLSSVLNYTFGVSGLFVNTLNPSISEYICFFKSPLYL